jgi:hypothetical protein
MAGLDPAIHVFLSLENVFADARAKPEHDDFSFSALNR